MKAVLKYVVVILKVYLAHGWNDAYEEKDGLFIKLFKTF